MKIFAIGDLHLSGNPPVKPMDIFDQSWCDHWSKIQADWYNVVAPDDLVLIAGDISWAMNLAAADTDLQDIAALPGKKILIRGNHDYWWGTLRKLNQTFGDKLIFIHNNAILIDDVLICGSRGWTLPNSEYYTDEDRQIFERELLRIEMSLQQSAGYSFNKLLLVLHFPPVLSNVLSSPVSLLCDKYKVDYCVYGHLHGEDAFKYAFCGKINNTVYQLVSADYLQFKLHEIR